MYPLIEASFDEGTPAELTIANSSNARQCQS